MNLYLVNLIVFQFQEVSRQLDRNKIHLVLWNILFSRYSHPKLMRGLIFFIKLATNTTTLLYLKIFFKTSDFSILGIT